MLRQPLKQNNQRIQVSFGASVPVPTGGWDAASPLSMMKPDSAVRLINWDPTPGDCRIRRGSLRHCLGVGSAAVESLMAYHGLTSSLDTLFAASSSTIYDVSDSYVASSSLTSLTNGRWQHVNHATTGGNFLFIVNGADNPRHWNGSAWATPSITVATAANWVHVAVHKRRIWAVEVNTTDSWYLPVDVVAGAATIFRLGPVFSMGGYLQAIGTWTIDAGEGVDDHLCFISSKGQVAIYKGTDPASADTWALVGVFNVGAPIGRRCLIKVGGDLALISVDGVLPLSKAIIFDRGAVQNVAITSKIQNAMNTAARNYKDNFGWQLIGYPKGTKAILNVPVSAGTNSEQYVMNTLTGAWTRYTGMKAFCWEVFQENLYFGGLDGAVYRADVGGQDWDRPIATELLTAFNYYGARGVLKRWTMVRPVMLSDGVVTPKLEVDIDFQVSDVTSTVSLVESIGAGWDEINWNEFLWGEDVLISSSWTSVNGQGYCAAIHMAMQVQTIEGVAVFDDAVWDSANFFSGIGGDVTLQISGFDVILERGGLT